MGSNRLPSHSPRTDPGRNRGVRLSVLVTGGCGFLGAHIVRRLLDNSSLDAEPVEVSVSEMKELFEKVKPQVIIHTASPDPLDTGALQKTNVDGTKILLRCATVCPETRAFVYTSSDSACQPTQEPIAEDKVKLYDEHHYNNLYGKTKAIGDTMVLEASSSDLHTATLRIPAIYGEEDHNFIPQLLESVRKGEHKMQIGNNGKLFEFCYVGSAAEAHILAAKELLRADEGVQDPRVDGEAFFIIDGVSRKFFDFARDAYAAAGAPVAPDEIKIIPLWAIQLMASTGEWAYRIFTLGTKKPKMARQSIDHLDGGAYWSIDKARRRLGYKPVLSQEDAIKQSVKWGLEHL
ncbi:NAD(P)-binding protein [Glonium stellatum]|uniref:NAD(P)-binding protein n=1 Tax=Glonium stellatum TaxID=574774 RepID=A0A8E2EVT5_9PEZI|nr:NAD(P)-binding protein [Glonium stellatum]